MQAAAAEGDDVVPQLDGRDRVAKSLQCAVAAADAAACLMHSVRLSNLPSASEYSDGRVSRWMSPNEAETILSAAAAAATAAVALCHKA